MLIIIYFVIHNWMNDDLHIHTYKAISSEH